jgi:hypothetical protein
MGWRELCGYQKAMLKQKKQEQPKHDRWTDADKEWWEEQREKRERLRGR